METLIGDVLLSSAFLAYAGYFDQQLRDTLFGTWTSHLQAVCNVLPWQLQAVYYVKLPWQQCVTMVFYHAVLSRSVIMLPLHHHGNTPTHSRLVFLSVVIWPVLSTSQMLMRDFNGTLTPCLLMTCVQVNTDPSLADNWSRDLNNEFWLVVYLCRSVEWN